MFKGREKKFAQEKKPLAPSLPNLTGVAFLPALVTLAGLPGHHSLLLLSLWLAVVLAGNAAKQLAPRRFFKSFEKPAATLPKTTEKIPEFPAVPGNFNSQVGPTAEEDRERN